jgi:hypothetical protein
MDIFKIDQLNELLNLKGLRQVTIYSPTSLDSTDNYQGDKIHFKNQLREAVDQLTRQYDMNEQEAKTYLQPGFDLLENQEFWQHNSDALAFFHSSKGTSIKQLPLDLDEPMTYVGGSFMLRPLIPLINSDGRFYILNLNIENVRLYEATPHTISEVLLSDEVPTTIDDYMKFVEREEHLQWRSGQGGKAGAMFHGQGATDTDKEDIKQYFHDLSNKLDDLMQCDPLPAVLAGVEYLIPIYKETSKYNKFVDDWIEGSFNENDVQQLHGTGMEIMEPHFSGQRSQDMERFGSLHGTDTASSDTDKVIKAALTGQVEILFVQEDANVWGVFNEQSYEIQRTQNSTPESGDLLTEAALRVIAQGGKVYPCAAEDMPGSQSVVAAIFRNPVVI